MGTGVSPRRIITGNIYDPCGIRTRVTAVKGRCLNPLTNGPYETPQAGLEPATLRLTAGCSAIELLRIININCTFKTGYKKHYIIKSNLGQALDLLVLVS